MLLSISNKSLDHPKEKKGILNKNKISVDRINIEIQEL